MRLRCFNVGQGNSLVVEILPTATHPHTRFGLVDSHFVKNRHGEPPALTYLKSRGVNELEFIALTHPDYDHAHGMGEIVDYFTSGGRRIKYFIESLYTCYYIAQLQATRNSVIGKAYQTIHSKELFHIHETIQALVRNNLVQHIFGTQTNLEFDLGGDLRLIFVAPSSSAHQREHEAVIVDMVEMYNKRPPKPREANEGSLAFIVKHGEKTIFFSGDVPDNVWREALPLAVSNNRSIASDSIVVTHHGSEHGNPALFWDTVSHTAAGKQSTAIISCGYSNAYKHPSERTLNRILSRKNRLYCINLGKPCTQLNVSTPPPGIPKILASALQVINKSKLEIAVSSFAVPAPEICSGTIELEIQAAGLTTAIYREQNSTCAYAPTKPGLVNPYP